jgi:hypothetical protein
MEEKKTTIDEEMNVLREVKSRIKGNPNCHYSNCHGKGYVGVVTNKVNGSLKPQLLLCSCAQFGETEYKILTDNIRQSKIDLGNALVVLNQRIIDLDHRTLLGFILWEIQKLWQLIKRQKKNESTH